jgi:hypothetical protein
MESWCLGKQVLSRIAMPSRVKNQDEVCRAVDKFSINSTLIRPHSLGIFSGDHFTQDHHRCGTGPAAAARKRATADRYGCIGSRVAPGSVRTVHRLGP